MQSVVFKVRVTISGKFNENIPREDYKEILDDDKFEMDQEMEVEIEGRILPDIQKILPDANVDLVSDDTTLYKNINNNQFEYTIFYYFHIQSEQLFRNYTKIKNIFTQDFFEIQDYIAVHADTFRNEDNYSDYSFIRFKVFEDPKVNATKRNIQARTAKRIFSANRAIPMNIIGEIGNMIGALPEGANRIRPLAEPLTNAAIERAAAAAAAPAPIPVQPPAPKKKAWWKFWGGRSRKARRRSKRRTYTTKRR